MYIKSTCHQKNIFHFVYFFLSLTNKEKKDDRTISEIKWSKPLFRETTISLAENIFLF